MYEVIRPVIIPSPDGSVSKMYRPGVIVDLPEGKADELVALGKLRPAGIEGKTGTVLDGVLTEVPEVELADEPEPEGEKPLKAHTVEELRHIAKSLGASADSVDHLKKPELLEAVERLTHTSD